MVEPPRKVKRATRAAAPPADVRARILAEAVRRFGADGFEASSLQSIAEAVGIRKPSLLYHFPSKEALHREVVECVLDHWRRELPRVLAESTTGYDRFASAMQALLAFFRAEPSIARLALREMLDRPKATRKRLGTALSPWIHMLAEYMRMGQASGIVKPELDPERYIVQVLMMVISTVAVGDVAAAIAGAQPAGWDERATAELVRIAREAVFVRPGATVGER